MKIEINYSEEELKQEKWLPIPHYENEYEVSNLGRIRTKKGKTTFTEKHGVRHWQQRIIKPKHCVCSKNKNRYDARVELWLNGSHRTLLVARIVIAAFDQRYDLFSKMTVDHVDNNSLNNRIENLRWCSLKENIQKAFEDNVFHYSKVKITNKLTGEETICRSMAEASKYIGQNKGYISEKIRQEKFESLKYKWEVVK